MRIYQAMFVLPLTALVVSGPKLFAMCMPSQVYCVSARVQEWETKFNDPYKSARCMARITVLDFKLARPGGEDWAADIKSGMPVYAEMDICKAFKKGKPVISKISRGCNDTNQTTFSEIYLDNRQIADFNLSSTPDKEPTKAEKPIIDELRDKRISFEKCYSKSHIGFSSKSLIDYKYSRRVTVSIGGKGKLPVVVAVEKDLDTNCVAKQFAELKSVKSMNTKVELDGYLTPYVNCNAVMANH